METATTSAAHRRIACALAVAQLALVIGARSAGAQCGKKPSGSPWGVSWDVAGGAAPGRSYDLGFAAGFRWYRIYIDWAALEPNPPDGTGHHPDPAVLLGLQQAVVTAIGRGYSINANIGGFPAWVPRTNDERSECVGNKKAQLPPADPSYVQEFARWVATTFGPAISAYEIWSESDLCNHFAGPPQKYREMVLTPAYDGIRAAGSSAFVVAPGILNSTGFDAWLSYYDTGKGRQVLVRDIDYYSLHLYEPVANGKAHLDAADQWQPPKDYDGNSPIIGYWLTEFGWEQTGLGCVGGTHGGNNTADPGTAATQILNKCWYGTNNCLKAFLYTLKDFPGCDFGILDDADNPKPRYDTIAAYLAAHPIQ
jgi:hypothetical protein